METGGRKNRSARNQAQTPHRKEPLLSYTRAHPQNPPTADSATTATTPPQFPKSKYTSRLPRRGFCAPTRNNPKIPSNLIHHFSKYTQNAHKPPPNVPQPCSTPHPCFAPFAPFAVQPPAQQPQQPPSLRWALHSAIRNPHSAIPPLPTPRFSATLRLVPLAQVPHINSVNPS